MMKNLFFLTAMLISAVFSSAQFQPDIRLTYDPGESILSPNNARCVAASHDTLHVVWRDNRNGNREIYYKRSTDGGTTWGGDIRLTNNSAQSADPCIAVSGSTVHVVWYDLRDGNEEIYYKRSANGGASWGADTRLTINTQESDHPVVAISGQMVHVVWEDTRDSNDEIYYKSSADGGVSWGADTRLTSTANESETPCISVSGLVVHVTWEEETSGTGTYEIYYKNSTDAGNTWGANTRLTYDDAESLDPCIASSGNSVHLTWDDDRDGNIEIYYKRSEDAGLTWSTDTRLTNQEGTSYRPSVCTDGQNVHISWVDDRDGNNEIYYKKSDVNGTDWEPDLRLTDDDSDSWRSSTAFYGEVVHVLWEDTRDGNYEIYYKQDPTGSIIEIPGDANCDGLVNVLDMITLVNYILGVNPSPFCFQNADVNEDGGINVLDIIGTVNIILGV